MHSMKAKARTVNILQTAFLILLALIVILPIYIAVANTFKVSDIILDQPLSLPLPPTLENIISVLKARIQTWWRCTQTRSFSWWQALC